MAGRAGGLLLLLALGALATAHAQSSVLEFLRGRKDLSITTRFVELAQAPAIFGPSPQVGIVLFAPTDDAWSAAAEKLGITLDPAAAKAVDGEELGSIMLYNMISGFGVVVKKEGSPDALAEKETIQSLLGVAYDAQLPIAFTRDGSTTTAQGLASGNSVTLPAPTPAGKSVVYVTDTVLLPGDSAASIPVPPEARRRR